MGDVAQNGGVLVDTLRGMGVELLTVAFDSPDAVKLTAEVQQEYVRRYGGEDATPVDPADFEAPRGFFLVAYDQGVPVACGGWRLHDADEPHFQDGDAEIKRMYVVESARGRGLARMILKALEDAALTAGRRRMVLETGTKQPEAIALYLSAGYAEIPKFGHYRESPTSRCYGKTLEH